MTSYDIKRININSIEPDYIPQRSPENVFNKGKNVRYKNESIVRVGGYAPVWGNTLFTPTYNLGIRQFNTFSWLYAGASAIGVVDINSLHYNITPITGVLSSTTDNWSGGAINGLAFLTSPLTAPIYWNGDVNTKMLTLPNWPVNTTTRCIRAYKNFFIALGIDSPVGFFGNMVKWSASADSGDIPQSWDITNPALDAGEVTLSTTPGNCIDCLPLNDYNVVYKDDSTHLMRYVGGQYIFSFSDLFLTSGIMGRDCVVEINGTHVVLTKDDLIQHDGSSLKSIATNRVRDSIFNSINTSSAANSFLVHHRKKDEIWICIPTGSSSLPDLAIIWNYKLDKFGTRILPNVPYISSGLINILSDVTVWDGDVKTWDSDSSRWTQQHINDISNDLVFPAQLSLMQIDVGTTDNGADIEAYVEKTTIQITDESEIAMVVRVIPNIIGNPGDTIKIKVGGQMSIGDPIDWGTQSDYILGTSTSHDCLVKGRYVSVQILSVDGGTWELNSIGVEFNSGSRF